MTRITSLEAASRLGYQGTGRIGDACRAGVIACDRDTPRGPWYPILEKLEEAIARHGVAGVRALVKDADKRVRSTEDDSEVLEAASLAAEREVKPKVRVLRPELPEVRVRINGRGRGVDISSMLWDVTQYPIANRAVITDPFELGLKFYPYTSGDDEGTNTVHVLVNGKIQSGRVWQHVGSDEYVGAVATEVSRFVRYWESVKLDYPDITPAQAIERFAREPVAYQVSVNSELKATGT